MNSSNHSNVNSTKITAQGGKNKNQEFRFFGITQ